MCEITKYQDLPKYKFSGGGYSATGKVTKYQDLPKYEFSGGGGILQLEKSQSTKIYLNMNFLERGGRGGYSATEKSQSTKKCLNSRGGGILQLKNHKVPRNA